MQWLQWVVAEEKERMKYIVVVVLAACLAVLPPAPTVSMAAAPGGVVDLPQETGSQKAAEKSKKTTKAAQAKKMIDSTAGQPLPAEPVEEEGMSTLTKVGLGVGVAAVVGAGLALAAGGGGDGDSGPVLPTPEILVGRWTARATSNVDRRTYTGVYNLYTAGSHTYDIYITGDNVRKRGRGNWTLIEGTNTLRLENDTGSVYVGDFQNENFTTITMTNQLDRWELVLTKQ